MKTKNSTGAKQSEDAPMKGIERHSVTTKAGNTLQFFYNPENNLVVVDLIAKNELGGNELVRITLDENKMLGHTNPLKAGFSSTNLKTPAEWCEKFGVEIIDPNGWNRKNPNSMEIPISCQTFRDKYWLSTTHIADRTKYDEYKHLLE